jgi:uncharacterized protein YkwD
VPVLTREAGLSSSCRDHADDLAPTEVTGNTGEDGSSPADRVDRYGLATGVEQNMAYSRISGIEVVIQMIIGDGD